MPKLKEADLVRLTGLLAALKEASKQLAPDIPLHNVTTLLFAAIHENMAAPYVEIGKEFNLPTPTITRSLDSMGTGSKWASRGFAVLQRAETPDRRFKEARVTPEGVKLLESMVSQMRKAEERASRKGGR